MNKVKMFQGSTVEIIERTVNAWLLENKQCEIVSITQSSSSYAMHSFSTTMIVVTIHYKEM